MSAVNYICFIFKLAVALELTGQLAQPVNCWWDLSQLFNQQNWINLSSWFDPINIYTTTTSSTGTTTSAQYPALPQSPQFYLLNPPLPYHLPYLFSRLPQFQPPPAPVPTQAPSSSSDETSRFFGARLCPQLTLPSSSKCTCEGPQSYPIVTCTRGTTQSVSDIIDNLDYPSLGRLLLFNVTLDPTFPLTTSRKPIQHLRLVKVTWSADGDGVTSSSLVPAPFPVTLLSGSSSLLPSSLRRFELIASGCTSFPFSHLSSHYTSLKDVDFGYNQLTSIPDHAFAYNPSLETIDFSHNNISYLGSWAFASLPNLRQLVLSHNRLKVVNNYALAAHNAPPPTTTSTKLRLIDLTYNQMFHLSRGTFDNQLADTIDLRYNSLVSLDETVFSQLIDRMSTLEPRQGQIMVDHNAFQCTCPRTQWLVSLKSVQKSVIDGFTCNINSGDSAKDLASLTLEDINC